MKLVGEPPQWGGEEVQGPHRRLELGQTPASPALSRPRGSPCRRFWSESERRAGLEPPLRKIRASRPRKSAVRPVYSSRPGVGCAQSRGGGLSVHPLPETLAGSHPPCAHPCPASPTYKGAGEGTAGLVWASPPPTFHTAWLQVEHVLGERKGGVSPGKAAPAPPPRQCPLHAAGVGVGAGRCPQFRALPKGSDLWHKGAL